MTEIRHPLASGKKSLVVTHNDNASAIIIKYDPPGSQLPRMLSGDFTTFEKASAACREYLNKVKSK